MAALPRLSVLDVSCNPQLSQEVGAGGFRELGAALSHCTALTTLRFQACGLTTHCLDVLGRRFTVNVSIMQMKQFSVAGVDVLRVGMMLWFLLLRAEIFSYTVN